VSRALPLLLLALIALPGAHAGMRSTCPGDAALGTVAYARGGALHLLDLRSCRDRVLVRRGATMAKFSADGQYVAVGRKITSVATGRVFSGPWVGTWAPSGHRMAAVTKRGGVVTGGPGLKTRRLVADGFGTSSLSWWGRSLVVGRYPRAGVWVVFPNGQRGVEADRLGANHNPQVAGVSHGWIFWWPFYDKAISANLDGRPLLGKRIAAGVSAGRFVGSMLPSAEFLSWCGQRLVVSVGADRYTTHGKRLVAFIASNTGPVWRRVDVSRDSTRSWVAPACSPDRQRIAASAGRNWVESRFGRESRGIWLLSMDGRERKQLTTPPAGLTDERPRWSADGRAILFVRSGPTAPNAMAAGRLYLVRLDGSLVGPIASLGRTLNYYGQYGWRDRIDVRP
jgi:WD40 repeat protein